jgi:hypothetical protein
VFDRCLTHDPHGLYNSFSARKRNQGIQTGQGCRRAPSQHSTFESMQLFIFAVETSGGLNKEARDFVKLPAKMSGGPMCRFSNASTRRPILCNLRTDKLHISTGRVHKLWAQHSTLAVEIQNTRVHQVNIAKRRYVTNTQPLQPREEEKMSDTHTHLLTSVVSICLTHNRTRFEKESGRTHGKKL